MQNHTHTSLKDKVEILQHAVTVTPTLFFKGEQPQAPSERKRELLAASVTRLHAGTFCTDDLTCQITIDTHNLAHKQFSQSWRLGAKKRH